MGYVLLFLVNVCQHFCFMFSDVKKVISSFCREKANVGGLTNFEVFDFLRSRGATSDPMGCLGSVAPSECKVPHFQTSYQSVLPVNWYCTRRDGSTWSKWGSIDPCSFLKFMCLYKIFYIVLE